MNPIDTLQPNSLSTISNEELKNLGKVYDELYKGKADAPSKEELKTIVLDMASRPEIKVDTNYKAPPCNNAVVHDSIALGLAAIGHKGGSGKKIRKKKYNKLPRHAKKPLIKNVKSVINMKSCTKRFATSIQ